MVWLRSTGSVLLAGKWNEIVKLQKKSGFAAFRFNSPGPAAAHSCRRVCKGERGAICEEVIVSYKPTVRNVAVRNASNIKQCRSSKNQNDNNNNTIIFPVYSYSKPLSIPLLDPDSILSFLRVSPPSALRQGKTQSTCCRSWPRSWRFSPSYLPRQAPTCRASPCKSTCHRTCKTHTT